MGCDTKMALRSRGKSPGMEEDWGPEVQDSAAVGLVHRAKARTMWLVTLQGKVTLSKRRV